MGTFPRPRNATFFLHLLFLFCVSFSLMCCLVLLLGFLLYGLQLWCSNDFCLFSEYGTDLSKGSSGCECHSLYHSFFFLLSLLFLLVHLLVIFRLSVLFMFCIRFFVSLCILISFFPSPPFMFYIQFLS